MTCKFTFNDYYGIDWDNLPDKCANENGRVDGEWFYLGVRGKLDA